MDETFSSRFGPLANRGPEDSNRPLTTPLQIPGPIEIPEPPEFDPAAFELLMQLEAEQVATTLVEPNFLVEQQLEKLEADAKNQEKEFEAPRKV